MPRQQGPVVVGVGADLDDGCAALDYAAAEANRRRVQVIVAHGLRPRAAEVAVHSGTDRTDRRDAAAAMLIRAADTVDQRLQTGIPTLTRLIDMTGVDALVHEAEDAGVIVLQRRTASRLERLSSGSTTTAVAARGACPVVIVRSGHEAPDPGAPVVVAVDVAGHARQALAVAFEEAARRRTALVAVHAWRYADIPPAYGFVPPTSEEIATLRQRAQRQLAEVLTGWATDYADVVMTQRVIEGPTEAVLIEQSHQAAVLVVGRHGSNGAATLALGRVARHCMSHALCPVLIAHESRPVRRPRRTDWHLATGPIS